MIVPPTFESAERLDELAEAFLDACRDGRQPSIEEYARQHPDLAERIRELFPALAVLEQAGGSDPERLGEFRIVRRIGRGGMGVVYEAVQEPLGRHVALKVLAVSPQTRPTVLERFQREARTAARLHHGNIVPVFGVGADRGTHFFAMQFIAGAGLDQVIAEVRRMRAGQATTVVDGSSSWLGAAGADYYRRAAAVAAQAADALDYAHRQGVLHRDVKPSNLLLDSKGTLWVADFGLAKEAGAENLTTTGDVVGTLRYLAPERLTGAADERSDVYSLGATVYELLTLHAAFDAADRPTLVKQLTDGDPVPPRRLDPAIPPDLETVVLKALAREPAARYATAADFAEDLRNVMADRPVKARRLSAMARATRWSRRNPGTAALIGVSAGLVLLVAVGATIAAAVFAHKNAELAAANTREQKRSQLAIDAIGMFHGQLSQDLLLKEPRFERTRTQIVTNAVRFYDQLEAQLDGQNDWPSRLALARAHDQLAELVARFRSPSEAISLARKSVAMRRHLAAMPAAGAAERLDLARRLTDLGQIQMTLRDAEAAVTFDEARQIADQTVREFGVTDDSRKIQAHIHERVGYCLWAVQTRILEARIEYQKALGMLNEAIAAQPADMTLKRDLGNLYMNIGLITQAPIQQRAILQKALSQFQTCWDRDSSNPHFKYDVAHVQAALCKILDIQAPLSEGLAYAESSIRICQELTAEYPQITDFLRVQAMVSEYAAQLYALDGRPGEARAAAQAALATHQKLNSTERLVFGGQTKLAETLTTLADLDLQDGRLEEALIGYRKALAILREIARTGSEWTQCNMAITIRKLGLAELAQGRPAEAAAATREARDLIEPRIRKFLIGPSYWVTLACCHATLAGLAKIPNSGVAPEDFDRDAERAIQTLRAGLAFSRPPIALLNSERGLDPVRDRPDFKAYVSELAALASAKTDQP